MNDSIRVLLVDDHAMLRAGFRTILDAQPDIAVVGEAASGAEAVAAASALRPDVITMDVQMPDMDGIEATRRIVADPELRAAIAIVTTFDRDDYLFAALDAGASGFLLKNAGPEDLIEAVRVLAAGDGMLAPEVTRRVIGRLAARDRDPDAADGTLAAGRKATDAAGAGAGPGAAGTAGARGFAGVSWDTGPADVGALSAPPAEPFTDREQEVLALMAEAMSNAEIAARLYIGEATVKTHVSRILQKLGARDRVQAVVLALRRGLA